MLQRTRHVAVLTALACPLVLAACGDDGTAEDAGEAVEEAADEAGDAAEEAVDDVEEAVDETTDGQ